MGEITGNISLKTKANVDIINEAGGNTVGKVYLPSGKELEIFSPAEMHIYNCNGVLVLEITHLYQYGATTKARERMIGNFVLLTYRDIKIEDCDKKEEKKNE